MKRLILIFIAIIFNVVLVYSQKNVKVIKEVDEFTGSVTLKTSPPRTLDYKTNGKLSAFCVKFINKEKETSNYYLFLSSSFYGDLGCVGKDRGKSYLKFADETVVELQDRGKLDCASSFTMRFFISKEEYDIISTKSLIKIRVVGTERSRDIKIRNCDQLKLIFQTLSFDTNK